MRESEIRRKNILIGGLLAVVVLMGIAYAAFSSSLNITGTGSTSGNWCIGFDSTRTSDYQATAGIQGGTTPTGSMAFSGNACASSFKTTASLNASFKQPGDKIEYTLTIGNKGSFAAAIESINVDNTSVTSNTTITKGNIKYIIEMPQSTSLAVNATTTMKVTAMFQNDTNISSSTTEQQTISIAINAAQDDGSGGMVITLPETPYDSSTGNGVVYSHNTTPITLGTSTINNLTSNVTPEPYYTNATSIFQALQEVYFYEFYNKYILVSNVIAEGYVCWDFTYLTGETLCLKMGTSASTYNYQNTPGNWATMNASAVNTVEHACVFDEESSFCGEYSGITAYADGHVSAYDQVNNHGCYSTTSGTAVCGS